jgi:hypothetical protein
MLPALDKLRLIHILAEELEDAKEIFPFESGKTYYLPTPYNSYGAAAILTEAMATHQEETNFQFEFEVKLKSHSRPR